MTDVHCAHANLVTCPLDSLVELASFCRGGARAGGRTAAARNSIFVWR
jgi:hypothetical protein